MVLLTPSSLLSAAHLIGLLLSSSVRLVICKDNYTSFRIVTAYPYPSFDEMDQWYDAVDQGF